VLVGPVRDEQKFTVHKDLVCASSKFFMAASSERWTEGKEKAVRLPEVKKETFQAYVVWVYAGKVNINKSIKGDAKLAAAEELRETVYLYLLGNVLDDLQLRNAAMRALVTGLKDWNVQPSCNLINHIWDSTPPGSLLRNMLVDFILKRWDSSFIKENVMAQYPTDLLATIAHRLLRESYFSRSMSYEVFAAGLSGYLEPETRSKPAARNKLDGRKKLEPRKTVQTPKNVVNTKNVENLETLKLRNPLVPRKKPGASKVPEKPRWR
jgi:hypothetical protein